MSLHAALLLGSLVGALPPDKRPEPAGSEAVATATAERGVESSTTLPREGAKGIRASSESVAGGFDGQFAASFRPSLELRAGTLELSLGARITSGTDGVRKRDWDEASDWTHILRGFRAKGSIGDVDVGLRGGELSGLTFGHGALVRDYVNNLDLDHGRASMGMVVEGPVFRTEALVDDFLAPHLALGRAGVEVFDHVLRFGVSGGADVSSPSSVAEAMGRRTTDAFGVPVATERGLGFLAADAEVALGKPSEVEVAPYLDVVNLLGFGQAAHVGGRVRKDFSGARFDAQAEWRFQSDDYLPGYLDFTYDVERYQSLTPGLSQLTKRAELAAARGNVNGFRFEAGLRSRWIDVRAGVEDRPGEPRGFGKVSMPLGPYARVSGLFAYSGGPLGAADLRVSLSRRTYLVADYTRRLTVGEDGSYRPLWAASAGLGLTIGTL